MVGRSVDKKDEIRAYIKARSKLGCSLKKLMTEISTAFGPSCVSYDTVRRWKKKFESGVESIKNAPKSGLFVLRFYGPVNPMGSCRARSVYLTTRLLGRLSPLSG